MSRLFYKGSACVLSAFILLSGNLPVRADPSVDGEPPGWKPKSPAVEAEPAASTRPETTEEPTGSGQVVDGPALPASKQASDFLSSICLEIRLAAAAHRLPASFLTRLIWQESRFDPRAVSRAGAQGIAQFMPGTARWRGLANPFDPHWSVRESARWLGELRSQFGNLGLAAAAYNAGPTRVQEWLDGKRGLPLETQAYVHIVTERAAEEWARSGVQDANSVLSAPADCRIQDLIRTAAPRTIRAVPPGPEFKRPLGKRQESVGKRFAWSLQLIGDRSEERALTEYRNLQKKFPAILGERPPVVIKRQLGGRGLARWYQVRVAESSRDAADAICSRLRSAGGQCLVTSN